MLDVTPIKERENFIEGKFSCQPARADNNLCNHIRERERHSSCPQWYYLHRHTPYTSTTTNHGTLSPSVILEFKDFRGHFQGFFNDLSTTIKESGRAS